MRTAKQVFNRPFPAAALTGLLSAGQVVIAAYLLRPRRPPHRFVRWLRTDGEEMTARTGDNGRKRFADAWASLACTESAKASPKPA